MSFPSLMMRLLYSSMEKMLWCFSEKLSPPDYSTCEVCHQRQGSTRPEEKMHRYMSYVYISSEKKTSARIWNLVGVSLLPTAFSGGAVPAELRLRLAGASPL
eukprot:gb/GECG01015125.1/.p1 GENE.gb/GECG01015125.1/~~gb/GECG01015125.1/.p1  ORF type:complete len:102 (+),score=10.41 gb/GECG01015125.1/:1-306(+)